MNTPTTEVNFFTLGEWAETRRILRLVVIKNICISYDVVPSRSVAAGR
jgi:hypothetical protein